MNGRLAFNGGARVEYRPRHCGCRRCSIADALHVALPWHKSRHIVETTVA